MAVLNPRAFTGHGSKDSINLLFIVMIKGLKPSKVRTELTVLVQLIKHNEQMCSRQDKINSHTKPNLSASDCPPRAFDEV